MTEKVSAVSVKLLLILPIPIPLKMADTDCIGIALPKSLFSYKIGDAILRRYVI